MTIPFVALLKEISAEENVGRCADASRKEKVELMRVVRFPFDY
jgi:hypothetical protein